MALFGLNQNSDVPLARVWFSGSSLLTTIYCWIRKQKSAPVVDWNPRAWSKVHLVYNFTTDCLKKPWYHVWNGLRLSSANVLDIHDRTLNYFPTSVQQITEKHSLAIIWCHHMTILNRGKNEALFFVLKLLHGWKIKHFCVKQGQGLWDPMSSRHPPPPSPPRGPFCEYVAQLSWSMFQ